MRLFAKRSRKSNSNKEKGRGEDVERTVFQSDPVVEELLKQDPTTWNAKQKRMVKRYQKRKEQKGGDEPTHNDDNDAKEATNSGEVSETIQGKPETGDSESPPKGGESALERDASNDDDSDDFSPETEAAETNEETSEQNAQQQETESSKQSELNALLSELNSKERRKLSRKLERKEATLDEVVAEAKNQLHNKASQQKQTQTQEQSENTATTPQSGHGQKRDASNADESEEATKPPKKKRRKKGADVDWSSLPPEERLRREEQRRLQKEAAERREQGLSAKNHTPGYKHPLNSERRRANRRKPKWAKKPLNDSSY